MTRMVAWLPRTATRRVVWNFALLFSIVLIACSGSRASLAQATISIFGNAVPVNAAEADSNAVTLGVKFWSAQPGASLLPPDLPGDDKGDSSHRTQGAHVIGLKTQGLRATPL